MRNAEGNGIQYSAFGAQGSRRIEGRKVRRGEGIYRTANRRTAE
jgi:hypothetical protein